MTLQRMAARSMALVFAIEYACACGAGATSSHTATDRSPDMIANAVPASEDASEFGPSPMYEALFNDGATFWYDGVMIEEDDDTGMAIRCRVSDVRRYPTAVVSRLTCDGSYINDERGGPPNELAMPVDVTPEGVYIATADGLYRSRDIPGDDVIANMPADHVAIMSPEGAERLTHDDANGRTISIYQSERAPWWCGSESTGEGWPDDGREVALCFRRGAGLVGGGYTKSAGDDLFRGSYGLVHVDPGRRESTVAAGMLVINEISAAGDDWFEIVNASDHTVQLDDFVFTDRPDDFSRVFAFPTATLAPGSHWVQPVSRGEVGFQLNGAESLTIYRSADLAHTDSVQWQENDSPSGGSYARVPDVTGAFNTVTAATPGAPNR